MATPNPTAKMDSLSTPTAPVRSASLEQDEPPPPNKPAPAPPRDPPGPDAAPEKPILKRQPSIDKDLGPEDNRTPRLSFNDAALLSEHDTYPADEYDRTNKDVDPLRTQLEVAREKKAAEALLKPKLIPICLDTRGKGVGFTITTMILNGKQSICVDKILEGSRAEKDGRFQEGDRLVEVDGQSLEHEPLSVAQEVLDGIKDISNFVMGRGGVGAPETSELASKLVVASSEGSSAKPETSDPSASGSGEGGEWEDKYREAVLEKTAAEQKLLEMELALSDTQAELDDMEESIGELMHRAKTAESKVKELQGAANAKAELEKAQRLLQTAQKNLATEKASNTKLKEDIEASTNQVNEELAKNTALEAEVKALKADLESARNSSEPNAAPAPDTGALKEAQEQNKTLESRVKELEQALEQEKTLRLSVQSDLASSKRETSQLQEAMEKLKAAPAAAATPVAAPVSALPNPTAAKNAPINMFAADPFGVPQHDLLNVQTMRDRRSASLSRSAKQRPPSRGRSRPETPESSSSKSTTPSKPDSPTKLVAGNTTEDSVVDEPAPPTKDAPAPPTAKAKPPPVTSRRSSESLASVKSNGSSSSLDKAMKFGRGLGSLSGLSSIGLKKRSSMDLGKALKPDPTKKPVATWTVEDVGIWVSDINNGDLANYAELFKSKDINGEKLSQLSSNQDLKDLGITSIGHRMLLRTRISNLK